MHTGFAAAAALLALAAAPALADEQEDVRGVVERQQKVIDDLQRRLDAVEGKKADSSSDDELEAAVDRVLERRRLEGSAAEDEYLLGGVARPANSRFRFGGYASVLYRDPDDPELYSSFTGIRVVPQFVFDVSKGIEFATEIEFEAGGFAEEFLDDGEVLVEYAEARFQVSDAFVPKAGILLIPFLRYNLNHDDPMWNLQDRPFTATRIFKCALQQPGVGAEGVFPLGRHTLNYNLALTNGMDDEVNNEGFEDARQGFRSDNNDNKTVWARFGATPRIHILQAADVGVSFARGTMDADGDVVMTGWGIDGKLTEGRFDFIFEFVNFHYERPATQPPADFPTQTHGAFVQVDTRLLHGLPESESGIVGKSSELILATRFEWADTNERVTGASREDETHAFTVGLAFRFTPKTVVRIERKWEWTAFDGPGVGDLDQWVASLSTYF
jgi:hypothetical protein